MRDVAHVLTLADGRALAWREYGDVSGVPCIYTTGTPASGLMGAMFDGAARTAGVRWISVDKPGYGLSDFQPRRTLLDWPVDVTALADHLGIDRFAAAGESGGGPYALALAFATEGRLTTAIVLAGMGPGDDPSIREGMKPLNRMLFGLAQRAPWALTVPLAAMGRTLRNPARAEAYMTKQMASAPAPDRERFNDPAYASIGIAASADAFRQGPRAAVQEMRMFTRPWGFRLEDIGVHVDLWHGELDVNVPVAIARRVAAAIPDCTARILPGLGHAVATAELDAIMRCARDAALRR